MRGHDWVEKNYKFLEIWSKRWSPENWDDLISTYCIYIDSNWTKFSAIPDGTQRLQFTQTWMKNNVKWYNSEFNKTIRTNNLPEEFEIKEEGEDEYLDVYCESDREDIRDFLLDLHRNQSEHNVNRILLVRRAYIQLPTHDKVLYDLYFTQMMSLRDISSKLDLPLSAVHNMMTELKNKIRISCGIQL